MKSYLPTIVTLCFVTTGLFIDQDDFERGFIHNKLKQLLSTLTAQIIEINSKSDVDYSTRGILYYQLGKTEKALADLSQAIKLAPQNDIAYLFRGTLYYKELGEKEKALADLNQTIKLNPQSDIAYLNRGILYGQLGETEKALTDFGQAIELNPQVTKSLR